MLEVGEGVPAAPPDLPRSSSLRSAPSRGTAGACNGRPSAAGIVLRGAGGSPEESGFTVARGFAFAFPLGRKTVSGEVVVSEMRWFAARWDLDGEPGGSSWAW